LVSHAKKHYIALEIVYSDARGWRRLHNEELHNLNASPESRAINSRGMRWAGHVAYMEETRNAHKILFGNT
jgi:surface antigen